MKVKMSPTGKCFFCNAECEETCDNCQIAFCSSNHLKVHRQSGKCSPWIVGTKQGVGRVVLAARDIQPFELVMRDTDLLGMVMMDAKACVNCGEKNNLMRCDCGFLTCKTECSMDSLHHECSELQKLNIKSMTVTDKKSLFKSLGYWRMIKMKETQPGKWEDLMKLMSHREKRRKSYLFRKSVKRLSKNIGRLTAQVIDEGLIRSLAGILETNSHSFNKSIHHIFNSFSLISHSCIPNCEHMLAGKQALVRAKMQIKKGDEITIRYSDLCLHRDILREEIQTSWLFTCSCQRCSENSELGTEASSFKCEKCGTGFVRKYGETGKIGCNICNSIITSKELVEKAKSLRKLERSCEPTTTIGQIPHLIKRMEDNGGHSMHHSVIQLKIRFMEGSMDNLDSISSQLVLEYSHDVKQFMKALNPGVSRLNGRLMFCTRKANAMLNKIKVDELIGNDERRARMNENKMLSGYFKD